MARAMSAPRSTLPVLLACLSLRQRTVVDLLAGAAIDATGGWLSGMTRLEWNPSCSCYVFAMIGGVCWWWR